LKGKKLSELKVESKEISFSDIGRWLEDKNKNLKGTESEILEKIGEKLEEFYVSLGEKLEVLEGIDIESKKEHGRAKLLVRQGLDKYIDSVHVLLKNLKTIKKDNLEKFSKEISRTFVLFEKSSAKVYERATYLVGDEIAAVRNEIRKFYNGLAKMFESEDSSIKDLKKVMDIKSKLNEFKGFKEKIGEVSEEIKEKDLKIEKAKKEVEKLMEEIEEIKNSSEYASNLKMIGEIKSLRDC